RGATVEDEDLDEVRIVLSDERVETVADEGALVQRRKQHGHARHGTAADFVASHDLRAHRITAYGPNASQVRGVPRRRSLAARRSSTVSRCLGANPAPG